MKHIMNEIGQALDAGLMYPALWIALTIPDVCGGIDDPSESNVGKRYIRWFDSYVTPDFTDGRLWREFLGVEDPAEVGVGLDIDEEYQIFNCEDAYLLRCSLLHQGQTIPTPKGQGQQAWYSRIIIAERRPGEATYITYP